MIYQNSLQSLQKRMWFGDDGGHTRYNTGHVVKMQNADLQKIIHYLKGEPDSIVDCWVQMAES